MWINGAWQSRPYSLPHLDNDQEDGRKSPRGAQSKDFSEFGLYPPGKIINNLKFISFIWTSFYDALKNIVFNKFFS